MLKPEPRISRRRYGDLAPDIPKLDKISISVRAHKLLKQLLDENPQLDEIMINSQNEVEALQGVKNWIMGILENSPEAVKFYRREHDGRKTFESLAWRDFTAIRLLDYIDNAGREF